MKKTISFISILTCALSLCVLAPIHAEDGVKTEQASLMQLMTAVGQNDYEAFLSNGTQVFQKNITKPSFDQVSGQLGDLIRQGYTVEYLSELYQNGNIVHVWKISYTGSRENSLAKLVLVNGKVAGFWLL